MKACTSFWAGAIAGFLFGSSKQGIKWRGSFENLLHSLVGEDVEEAKMEAEDGENTGDGSRKAHEKRSVGSEAPFDSQDSRTKQQKKDHKHDLKKNHRKAEHAESASEPEPPEEIAIEATSKSAIKKGLDPEKAQELAEKLGAKVSEPEGENAIPHAHPIDTSTSTLSA